MVGDFTEKMFDETHNVMRKVIAEHADFVWYQSESEQGHITLYCRKISSQKVSSGYGEDLLGYTIVTIKQIEDEELQFTLNNGQKVIMYHDQDCCESVTIEDIVGNLDDLIGSPLTMAEVETSEEDYSDIGADSCTWTFYKLATNKGYVTIRWYGESNGWYSEEVTLKVMKEEEK